MISEKTLKYQNPKKGLIGYIREKNKGLKKETRINIWCWIFMIPTLTFYTMFLAWPLVSGIYYSFFNWSGLSSNMEFVGLNNYLDLFKDKIYWNAFRNSFKFMLLLVPIQVSFSLFIAYLLNNEKLKGRSIYRTFIFLPVVTTAAIVGIIMVFIWGAQGPVNDLLLASNIIKRPINFLGNPKFSLGTVVLISVWKDVGIYMIYWLAALQSVPKDLYEAANIDGAGRTTTFFKVVLPLILPIGGVITILCTITSLKVFDIIKTMTDGGPFFKTDVMGTYVYRMAFSSEMGMPRLGYASSAAIFYGISVICIGVALSKIKKRLKEAY